jgi:hypothetical protein
VVSIVLLTVVHPTSTLLVSSTSLLRANEIANLALTRVVVAAIGACIATNDATQWGRGQDTALCGHFHVFNTVGQNDTTYTRDECLQSMQELAVTNKCSRVNSDWCLAQNSKSLQSCAVIGRLLTRVKQMIPTSPPHKTIKCVTLISVTARAVTCAATRSRAKGK